MKTLQFKNILFLALISSGILLNGCDIVKSDADDIRTIQLETNKFEGSNFALNMTEYFPDNEIVETSNLSSFTLTDGVGDKYLIYKDNVESFSMLLTSGGENVIAKIKQNFIDASICSSSDNFTSATISNDEVLNVDLLTENVDLCGASDYDINWLKITNSSDGEYDKYELSGYTGGGPGEGYMTIEFDPLDDFTGTVEVFYTVSLGIDGSPNNPVGQTWSSTHTAQITVTD